MGGWAAVVGSLALAGSQMYDSHEETVRAQIEADRADGCEYDYRNAMADLLKKIEEKETR